MFTFGNVSAVGQIWAHRTDSDKKCTNGKHAPADHTIAIGKSDGLSNAKSA